MKKPRHPVTDHAVLRYLERVEGVDIEAIRCRIGHLADRAIEMGANGVVSGGFVYRIDGGHVVTVLRQSRAERGKGKGRRRGA
ncbi:hypothetical protein [Roseovarius sp. MBR-6]|jgi:formylmethanofuran dehydrogenase subunit B|uniref:hypothetical protein n=1 Tax=Roseovarius sp. MBR-6 TaxID=3156459 RepID=UPI003396D677